MTDKGKDKDRPGQNTLSREILTGFIERIERIRADKKDLADDEKAVFAEAKANGFLPEPMRDAFHELVSAIANTHEEWLRRFEADGVTVDEAIEFLALAVLVVGVGKLAIQADASGQPAACGDLSELFGSFVAAAASCFVIERAPGGGVLLQ